MGDFDYAKYLINGLIVFICLVFAIGISGVIFGIIKRRMAISTSIETLEEFIKGNNKFEKIDVEIVRDMIKQQTKEHVPFSRKKERIRSVVLEALEKISKSKNSCTSIDCAKALKVVWVRRWSRTTKYPTFVYAKKI